MDLNKDWMTRQDLKKIFLCPNIRHFKNLYTMVKNDWIEPMLDSKSGGTTYYRMKDIKEELLRRECACWKDYAIYRKELYSGKRHLDLRRKRYDKQKVKIILNGKEVSIGTFNHKFVPKLKRIINDIYLNKELFDPNREDGINPFYLYCLNSKITTKNVDTFDVIKELKKFQESRKPKKRYHTKYE